MTCSLLAAVVLTDQFGSEGLGTDIVSGPINPRTNQVTLHCLHHHLIKPCGSIVLRSKQAPI